MIILQQSEEDILVFTLDFSRSTKYARSTMGLILEQAVKCKEISLSIQRYKQSCGALISTCLLRSIAKEFARFYKMCDVKPPTVSSLRAFKNTTQTK